MKIELDLNDFEFKFILNNITHCTLDSPEVSNLQDKLLDAKVKSETKPDNITSYGWPSLSSKIKEEVVIIRLENLIDVQGTNGNWNYDNYMLGFYNGLVLALNVVRNDENDPAFREKPEEGFITDMKDPNPAKRF